MEIDAILNLTFAGAAVASAVAALIAALRAGRAEQGVAKLTIEVNSRLDQLLAGSRAAGEIQGRADERAERADDEDSP